jgi:hypothetical protein
MNWKQSLVLLLAIGFSCILQAQLTMDWAVSWGSSPYAENLVSMASDAAGNVYVTGSFRDTVDFDPGAGVVNLNVIGLQDLYVAKYGPTGNLIWVRQIGGAVMDPVSLKLDAVGNIYLAGFYMGIPDFDPGPAVYQVPNAGNDDIFICKLDPSGNFAWAKSYGDQPVDQGQDIAIDPAGNVYLTGFFTDFVNFGGGTFISNNGSYDLFVLKLDPAGNFLWAKQIGGPDMESISDIAVDSQGNVILTGFFRMTVDFDPGTGSFPMTAVGLQDIFMLKLDSGGGFVWAYAIGSPVSEVPGQVVVDANDNIYLSGEFLGTMDLAPGATVFNATSTGNSDVFLDKLNPQGGLIWCKTFGGIGGESPRAMEKDLAGNIYLTGLFSFTPDFDPGPGIFNITATGNYDGFVMKLDSSGGFRWAGSISGAAQDMPSSIAMGDAHTVYVGGDFMAAADFDPTPGTFTLTSNGGYDAFLVKYAQCANQNTTATISPTVCDTFVAPDGAVYTQSGSYVAMIPNQVGCDSLITIQLTVRQTTSTTIAPTVCDSFVSPDGNVYTQTGTYIAVIPNTQGCDSIITIQLTVQTPLATTQVNGATITAIQSGAQYQWLDCDNLNAPIPGATAQSYTTSVTGSFALVVTVGVCSDTSDCQPVIVTGGEEPLAPRNWISPNPSAGQFSVHATKPASLAVFAANGACVYTQEKIAPHEELDLRHLPAGVYYVRLWNQSGTMGTKILIQR